MVSDNIKRARKSGASTPRSRGAYGSKRGADPKSIQRAKKREEEGRVRDSLGQAESAQEALERRIAREQRQPTLGETEGAAYARLQREREAVERAEAEHRVEAERERLVAEREAAEAARLAKRDEIHIITSVEHPGPRFEPWDGDPRAPWTIGAARHLLRDGYTVQQVMRQTKIGYRWLYDLELDEEGRLKDLA